MTRTLPWCEPTLADDYAALSLAGALLLAEAIGRAPDAAVVVATGSTPMGIYDELARIYGRGELNTSRLRVFQLDAYCDIAADDHRSLFRWMDERFVRPLGIAPAQVVRLLGDSGDHELACHTYAAAVRDAGGFDIAILGLGPNGHLGFNEPPSAADAPTRRIALSEASMVSNAAYWGGREQVPTHALTCGMDLLLAARSTLLLVSGAHKRSILRATIHGPETPDVPASLLRRATSVTVLADRAAWGG